jgi:hypothetical protein
MMGIFKIGSRELFALILLISASWVARITGISHRRQALGTTFFSGIKWILPLRKIYISEKCSICNN